MGWPSRKSATTGHHVQTNLPFLHKSHFATDTRESKKTLSRNPLLMNRRRNSLKILWNGLVPFLSELKIS